MTSVRSVPTPTNTPFGNVVGSLETFETEIGIDMWGKALAVPGAGKANLFRIKPACDPT